MIYRGRECTVERPFANATGEGTEYLQDGEVVVSVYTTRVVSPAELAVLAAEAREIADSEASKLAARKVVDDIRSGLLTFGDSKRDEAMLVLAGARVIVAGAASLVEGDDKL
jgi:hypothetical protein